MRGLDVLHSALIHTLDTRVHTHRLRIAVCFSTSKNGEVPIINSISTHSITLSLPLALERAALQRDQNRAKDMVKVQSHLCGALPPSYTKTQFHHIGAPFTFVIVKLSHTRTLHTLQLSLLFPFLPTCTGVDKSNGTC